MTQRTITIFAEALRRAVEDYVARKVGTHLANVQLSGSITAVVEDMAESSPDRGGVPVGGRVRGEG